MGVHNTFIRLAVSHRSPIADYLLDSLKKVFSLTHKMKFLFLTVALVHCAFGAAEDQKDPALGEGGLDDDDVSAPIQIISCDDVPRTFEIPHKAAQMCTLITNI